MLGLINLSRLDPSIRLAIPAISLAYHHGSVAMRCPARPGLRTKTGCLTCRRRKKKCDEVTPICGGCRNGNRACRWPSQQDLLDHRFSSYPRPRRDSLLVRHGAVRAGLPTAVQLTKVSNLAIEGILSRHFVEQYYSLVLLPGCHSGFSTGWLAEIIMLMPSCEALYCAVLACAASHLHLVDSCAQMQDLALTYYSATLAKLSRLLADTPYSESHDGILTSMIWLNIHGVR